MNKKGTNLNSFFLSICIILVIWIILVGFNIIKENKLREEACKSLRFVSHEYKQPWDFCKDSQGNLHFVEIKIEPWYYPSTYEIKEISVGDVRVIVN